jgi:phage terminase large subunit-like protein
LFWPKSGALAVWCWCPAENLDQREVEDRVPYRVWSKQGHLIATPGRAIDKQAVAHTLGELQARFKPKAIAFDRWGMAELDQHLKREGVTLPLEPFGQGFASFGPAVAATEERILNGRLTHPSHPVLTWCISNTIMETDAAGNRKPSKRRSSERIDAAVAMIMAIGLAAQKDGPRRAFTPFVITAGA